MAKNNIDGFDAGGIVNGLDGDDYSPFDKPIKKEIQERLDNEEHNFGNSSSFEIEDEGFYQQTLNDILTNPFKVESLIIECEEGCSIDRIISQLMKSANGQIIQNPIHTSNYFSPSQFDRNIVKIDKTMLINVGMSLLVPVEPNEKVGLFLLEKNDIKLKFAKA